MTRTLLIIDGLINLALGTLLAVYPEAVIKIIGLPAVELPFYASILGAVIFGIGIALIVQIKNPSFGLGLGGAVAINLSGGFCLAAWLIFGNLTIPAIGYYIMWGLVIILFSLSTFELVSLKNNETTHHRI
jgi:hypothetical protein